MEKINIAELLKDCPKGMELDCLLYNNVTFLSIDDDRHTIFPIKLLRSDGCELRFTKYGQYANMDDAKCVIFPKNKTTWEGFQRPFKDGDILINEYGNTFIYKGILNKTSNLTDFYCGYRKSDRAFCPKLLKDEYFGDISKCRFATEEEKQKLFDAIKKNGYCWNAETKTLEKLVEPKFKIGDKVLWNYNTEKITKTISDVLFTKNRGYVYWIYSEGSSSGWWGENELTPIPNKFDITTLKPFDKVLVRNTNKDYWEISMFGHISNHDKQYFMCIANSGFYQCVPYNDETKHLLDTTNDCSDYYKTW